MPYALRLMHEERLERFEDFRDANDRSSAGNDASSSGGSASSVPDSSMPDSSVPDGISGAPNDASVPGGTEWIAEAREEASRRKSDHPQRSSERGRRNPEARDTFRDKHRSATPVAVTGPVGNDGSDEAIFLRYQQGDDHAFFTIYERYKSSIYAYCAQVLFSAGLSRETVEDTLSLIHIS